MLCLRLAEKSCSEERIEVAIQQHPSDSITSFAMIVKNERVASLRIGMTARYLRLLCLRLAEKSCSEERIEVAIQQHPSDSITSFAMIVKNERVALLRIGMTEMV